MEVKIIMKDNMIRDISLAPEGLRKIAWVRKNMPILRLIEDDFKKNEPFKGLRITVCVHLEAKTAWLALVLKAGGADVSVTGSNAFSTKDDVVAALAASGLHVYAWHGATKDEFHTHMNAALDIRPNIVIDDGGDLVHILHEEREDLLTEVFGACEETTAGVLRNRAREASGKLKITVIAVNDARCKFLFDSRYGTGHSTLDAIMRTTNLAVTGKTFVVAGYGWVGKGIAMRAKGIGASVIVCEIDPVKAIEAVMDGFRSMTMDEAAKEADFIITATGCKDVIVKYHFETMKDGVILGNAGHFANEIDLNILEELSVEKEEVRDNLFGYKLEDGKWINVLGDGNIVNISCADGHPAEFMDLSFAIQALSAKYVADNHKKLDKAVIMVPSEIDNSVANLKLQSMGIKIDTLTVNQEEYLSGFTIA